MAYPVDSTDVEARYRELSAEEAALTETLLEDATVLLDNLRPILAVQYAAGKVDLALIRMVLVRAVKRVLANPEAARAQSIGADGAVAVTFGLSTTGTQILDGLYISDGDLADLDRALGRAATGSTRRAGSQKFVAYPEPADRMSILPLP